MAFEPEIQVRDEISEKMETTAQNLVITTANILSRLQHSGLSVQKSPPSNFLRKNAFNTFNKKAEAKMLRAYISSDRCENIS